MTKLLGFSRLSFNCVCNCCVAVVTAVVTVVVTVVVTAVVNVTDSFAVKFQIFRVLRMIKSWNFLILSKLSFAPNS